MLVANTARAKRISLGIAALAVFVILGLIAGCGGGSSATATSVPNATSTLAPGATSTSPGAAKSEPIATANPGQSPGGHQGDEGLPLTSETGEIVYAAARCDPDATVRSYEVSAINLEITLNRFLDYDPLGRMYVLDTELERAMAEQAQNRAARLDEAEPAVTIGLQGDAIQPLTIRANQGECLRISLTNAMDNGEPASLHLHGSGLYLVDTGAPAVAANPDAAASPGTTVTYEWMVAEDQPEGTHYFHSHGDTREQTSHGLFGALIIEPKGSHHLDPSTRTELRSGWSAIIQDSSGSDFREYAIYYHEIGNEAFTIENKDGAQGFGLRQRAVPFVDSLTGAYKPGGRAINYRSEPFLNRLQLQKDTTGILDPSQAYSSYTFGDPATLSPGAILATRSNRG